MKVQNSLIEQEISLSDFLKKNNIANAKLSLEDKIVLLPLNHFLNPKIREGNLYPSSTKALKIYFLQNNLLAELLNDSKPKEALVLKSADIILPILLFVGSNTLNVGLGLLTSWLYDRFAKYKKIINTPVVELEFAHFDEDNKIKNWHKIKGNVNDVCEVLNKLNPDNKQFRASSTIKQNEIEEPVWVTAFRENAIKARISADALINEGNVFLRQGLLQIAEQLFRKSLLKLREAHLWEPENNNHIKYLHSIGIFIHEHFRCTFSFEDGKYWEECPVRLSHNKGGFSIGGAGRQLCSICSNDALDCEHVPGDYYDNVRAIKLGNSCNICGERDCNHICGEYYDNVMAFMFLTDCKLDHVAFVERPSNPLCVITSIPIEKYELEKELSSEELEHFEYGKSKLYCHHCIKCNGT